MTEKKNTAIGLFLLPLFVMASLQVVVEPLGELISLSWIYFCIWYGLALQSYFAKSAGKRQTRKKTRTLERLCGNLKNFKNA